MHDAALAAKIRQLIREGYPQRQAVAIAYAEQRQGTLPARHNPAGLSPDAIFAALAVALQDDVAASRWLSAHRVQVLAVIREELAAEAPAPVAPAPVRAPAPAPAWTPTVHRRDGASAAVPAAVVPAVAAAVAPVPAVVASAAPTADSTAWYRKREEEKRRQIAGAWYLNHTVVASEPPLDLGWWMVDLLTPLLVEGADYQTVPDTLQTKILRTFYAAYGVKVRANVRRYSMASGVSLTVANGHDAEVVGRVTPGQATLRRWLDDNLDSQEVWVADDSVHMLKKESGTDWQTDYYDPGGTVVAPEAASTFQWIAARALKDSGAVLTANGAQIAASKAPLGTGKGAVRLPQPQAEERASAPTSVFYPDAAESQRPTDSYGSHLTAPQVMSMMLDAGVFHLTNEMFTPGNAETRRAGFDVFVRALAKVTRVGVIDHDAARDGGTTYLLVTHAPVDRPVQELAFEYEGHWYLLSDAWMRLYGKYAHHPRVGPWFGAKSAPAHTASAPAPAADGWTLRYVKQVPGEEWANIGAVDPTGRNLRYGWSVRQKRWARNDAPPASILRAARAAGFDDGGEAEPDDDEPDRGQAVPAAPRPPRPPSPPPAPKIAPADKLRALADAMEATIESKESPAIGNQNFTLRRARIAGGMREEGEQLRRVQTALRAIADASDAGTLPDSLTRVGSRADVDYILRTRYFLPDPDKDRPGSDSSPSVYGSHWYTAPHLPAKVQRRLPNVDRAVPITQADYEAAKPYLSKMEGYSRVADSIRDAGRFYRLGFTSHADRVAAYQALTSLIAQRPAGRSAAAAAQQARHAEAALARLKIPGFFPTPVAVADRMARWVARHVAGNPAPVVYEPSAGTGRLVDAVLREVPGARVIAAEQSYTLAEHLRQKYAGNSRVEVVQGDGLEVAARVSPDAVIMNPPFEHRQDAKHVVALVERWHVPTIAIVGASTLTADDRASNTLRDLRDQYGDAHAEPLPSGTFETTGVASAIITFPGAEVERVGSVTFPVPVRTNPRGHGSLAPDYDDDDEEETP